MSPALIAALIQLAVTYGPQLVTEILSLWKSQNPTDPTVDQWITLFAGVKPYSAYGIPATIPNPAAKP